MAHILYIGGVEVAKVSGQAERSGLHAVLRWQFMLFLFTLVAMSAASASTPTELRYYDGPAHITDTSVWLDGGSPGSDMRVEARVALSGLKERAGYSREHWALCLRDSGGDSIVMRLRWGNTDFGSLADERYVRLDVERGDSSLLSVRLDGFATSPEAYNTLAASLSEEGTHLRLSGGGATDSHIATLELSRPLKPDSVGLSVCGKAEIAVFGIEVEAEMPFGQSEEWTIDLLKQRFASTSDPLEGFWTHLDRENNPAYARPGGTYTLAVVRTPAGTYDILYISGARILADKWKPCMLKGSLVPTIFVGQYTLMWIDSEFEPITEDLSADITDNSVLALRFPLYESVIRLSKQR